MPAAEELWKHGFRFIGVIKTSTRQFLKVYLSNIESQNWGDMSGLLTRLVDRTKPVLGAFVWMDSNRQYLILRGSLLRKGGRTLAHDLGKRTLPQIQSSIWLS